MCSSRSVSSSSEANRIAALTEFCVSSVDVEPADGDREHLRLQPRAAASRARARGHVFLDPLALRGRVGLAVAALEVLDDPFEGEHVGALPAHAVAVLDVDSVAVRPVEEQVLLFLGQVGPGCVEVDLVAVGDRLDHGLVEARPAHRPGNERPVADRERAIRNQQVGVDLLLVSEPGAARARAVRRVEREDARLELGEPDAVLRAGESLRERQLVSPDHVDRDQAVGERERGLDRVGDPVPEIRLHDQPVDDDLDRMLELLVELDLLLQQALVTVDLHAGEALVAQPLQELAILALAVADDRCVDGELRSLGKRQNLVDDRLDRLAGDRPPADRAVRLADAGVEQPQIVVDLRHRADRRARVPRGRLLVDRDRG